MTTKSLVDILSDDDIKILSKILLNKKPKGNLRSLLKRRIRYKITKKVILFYLRFTKIGIDSWQIYNCHYSLKKIQTVLKSKNVEFSNFTKYLSILSQNPIKISYIYYVTSNRISSQYISDLPEGVLLRFSPKTCFILSNKNLEERIEAVAEANKLTEIAKLRFAPYRLNQIIKTYNKKITSIVYSTNPEITGVKGVSEIEFRGDDVITGLSYLLARLDRFRRLTTIFGPIIKIKFENDISINVKGQISAKKIDSILDFLSYLDKLIQQKST